MHKQSKIVCLQPESTFSRNILLIQSRLLTQETKFFLSDNGCIKNSFVVLSKEKYLIINVKFRANTQKMKHLIFILITQNKFFYKLIFLHLSRSESKAIKLVSEVLGYLIILSTIISKLVQLYILKISCRKYLMIYTNIKKKVQHVHGCIPEKRVHQPQIQTHFYHIFLPSLLFSLTSKTFFMFVSLYLFDLRLFRKIHQSDVLYIIRWREQFYDMSTGFAVSRGNNLLNGNSFMIATNSLDFIFL